MKPEEKQKIMDKLGQVLHPDYYVSYEQAVNMMREYINALPEESEYIKALEATINILHETGGLPNQIAIRKIEEYYVENGITDKDKLLVLINCIDWLSNKE